MITICVLVVGDWQGMGMPYVCVRSPPHYDDAVSQLYVVGLLSPV